MDVILRSEGLYIIHSKNIRTNFATMNFANYQSEILIGFPKNQNLTTKSGSKQRFSLLQEKVVIQAVYLRTQTVSIKARF